jgi:integrase
LFHIAFNHILASCLPGADRKWRLTFSKGAIVRTKLTPAFVQKARAEDGVERALFWDEDMPGFGLVVTSSGHRSFVVQYRAGGRSRRMTIDGVLGLAAARKRARALLGEVAKDRDPLQERRNAISLAEDTFQSIAEAYFAREGKRLRTVTERRVTLGRLVYPRIGSQAISTIRRSDIVRLLDRIEDENGPVMADRTLAYIRKVMNWHASRSDEFRSPIVRGMARTSGKERARARILTDAELQAIWRAAGGFPGPFGAFLKFLLLTGARRTEASEMTWSEISGADWTLPAARNKVKVVLVRPLSVAAQTTIAELPRVGRRGFVFTTGGDTPVGGFSKFKRRFDRASGVAAWTLHDLRRTARSLMSRAGVPSDHAERCLGHVMPGVRGTYDRHEYLEEKRHAFEALAAQIERIVNPVENVVPLRGAV